MSWVGFWIFLNKNFLCGFFFPKVEGAQIVFPCVVSDENAFLPLFLSVRRTSGKFFRYYSKTFIFFSLGLLTLYFGLMPCSSVADQSYQKRCLLDKQSNLFFKINLVIFAYIKIDCCMLFALPWSKNGSKIEML